MLLSFEIDFVKYLFNQWLFSSVMYFNPCREVESQNCLKYFPPFWHTFRLWVEIFRDDIIDFLTPHSDTVDCRLKVFYRIAGNIAPHARD